MFFFINSLNSDFPLFRLGSFNSPSYYFLRKTRKKLVTKCRTLCQSIKGTESMIPASARSCDLSP